MDNLHPTSSKNLEKSKLSSISQMSLRMDNEDPNSTTNNL
jgi:hypothetical protein